MHNNSFIPINNIYDNTSGGLDVFLHYYPESEKSLIKKNGKFKIREEKTASANLYQDGSIWYLKDHGGAKRKNAIEAVMDYEQISFQEALHLINKKFCNNNIGIQTIRNQPQAQFIKVSKTEKFEIVYNNKLSNFELNTFGEKVTQELCDLYNLKSVKHFIREGKKYQIHSTETYPILCFDYGEWKKIYQPLSNDEAFRFSYVGSKPKDYIFGLEQIKNRYEQTRMQVRAKIIENVKGNDEHTDDERINKLVDEFIFENKLKKDIFICSGDRDALNVSSLGNNVVWMNSETAVLKQEHYNELKRFGNEIYIVPDLDETGMKQATELCLKYLDIKIVRLPEELKQLKDFRRNACKDVSDFLKHTKRLGVSFEKLRQNAEPLKFWNAIYDSKGNFKSYTLNTVSFLNFLQANGYFRIEDKSNEYGYVYIKIKKNIVEKIVPKSKTKGVGGIKMHVKDFLNDYMKHESSALRNKMFRTKETDENILSNLPTRKDLDFKTYDKNYMYLTFPNVAWKITKDELTETKLNDINKHIWKTDIKDKCKHVRKLSEPIFEINYTKEYEKIIKQGKRELIDNYPDIDRYTIKINDKSFIFMQFLKNTSRMYWQKEKQGIKLTEIEKKEQDLHLINKIYSLGYLASRYKDPDKPWAVWALDARESDIGKSYGGSGKSLCYSSLKYINKTFDIPGRNSEKTKDKFIFDGVDEHTFTINVNDADQYLNFGFFFPYITDDLRVEVKNSSAFFIPFSKSAKFVFSSNFSLKNIDPSTKRRLLYTAFSDYYHEKDEEGSYEYITSPGKEFGKKLFLDFIDEEWNKFYNFFASAIQTFMKIDNRIEPPMENIVRKNLKADIGQNLFEWFSDYFSDTSKLNSEIERKDIYEFLKMDIPQISKYLTPQKFKKKLQNYCKYRSWTFNPNEKLSNKTQILKGGIEYFYIETTT